MPKPDFAKTSVSDHVDSAKQGLHLQTPGVSETFDPHKPILVVVPAVAWRVTDLTTGATRTFASDGGHFKSEQGHKYAVYLDASYSQGIQKLTLDGSGSFACVTDPDRGGIAYDSPGPLTISTPHQEFDNPTAPILPPKSKELVLNPFDYFALSAGFHHYGNMPSSMEFFAVSGTMTFTATAVGSHGVTSSGSLTTAP